MFHIYQGKFRVTGEAVSYNALFKHFESIKDMPWGKISTLPIGESVLVQDFRIVRFV